MRKIKIEIISGILSAVMILSSLPVTVFADKNTDENTVPTIESEIIYSEPTTEVVDVSFEETVEVQVPHTRTVCSECGATK